MRICWEGIRVERHRDFGKHLPSCCIGGFHQPIRACGIQLPAINSKAQAPTTPFVSSCSPCRFYLSMAIFRNCRMFVATVVASYWRKAKGVDVAPREPDRKDRLSRMDCLGKEVGRER